MPAHELTLHRLSDWGEVALACSVCGSIGKFQTAAAAYEHHSRRVGAGPMPSMCRGVSLRTGRTP